MVLEHEVLAEHKKEHRGASYDTDHEVIEECTDDCPRCAQQNLMRYLNTKVYYMGSGIYMAPDMTIAFFTYGIWDKLVAVVDGE